MVKAHGEIKLPDLQASISPKQDCRLADGAGLAPAPGIALGSSQNIGSPKIEGTRHQKDRKKKANKHKAIVPLEAESQAA